MKILLLLFAVAALCDAKGTEFHVKYVSDVRTGIAVPNPHASQFTIHSDLTVSFDDSDLHRFVFQFKDPKVFVANGKIPMVGPTKSGNFLPLPKSVEKYFVEPFVLTYDPITAIVQTVSTKDEHEPEWSLNMKKSIGSIVQIEKNILVNTYKEVKTEPISFHVVENTTYGESRVSHTLFPKLNDVYKLTKYFDPKLSTGYETKTYSTLEATSCHDAKEHDDEQYSYDVSRTYYFVPHERFGEITSYIEAVGKLYVYPFYINADYNYVLVNQTFSFLKFEDVEFKTNFDDFKYSHGIKIQQGGKTEKSVLEEIAYHFIDEEYHYDSNIEICKAVVEKLNDQEPEIMKYAQTKFAFFTFEDLQTCYNELKESTEKTNIFLNILGVVETSTTARFIVHLLKTEPLSRARAMNLLEIFGRNNHYPTVEMLKEFEVLLDPEFPLKKEPRSLAILNYGAFIYKTYKHHSSEFDVEKYIKIYYNNLVKAETYGEQLTWLHGLMNIEVGSVWKLILPLVRGEQVLNLKYDRHLRTHASYAATKYVRQHQTEFYDAIWPLLVDSHAHIELRVSALNVYFIGMKELSDMTRLIWKMQEIKNPHLYNYFMTLMSGYGDSSGQCLSVPELFQHEIFTFAKKYAGSEYSTAAFVYDQYDATHGTGGRIEGGTIANEKNNQIESFFIQIDQYAMGNLANLITFYIKFDGIDGSPLNKFFAASDVDVDQISKTVAEIQAKEVNSKGHVEITARYNGRTIYTYFKDDASEKSTEPPMFNELVFNQMFGAEKIFYNDMGLPVVFYGNFPYTFKTEAKHEVTDSGHMKFMFILDLLCKGEYGLRVFNPFSNIWHGSERQTTYNVVIPFAVDISVDPKEAAISLVFDWADVDKKPFKIETDVRTVVYIDHLTDKEYVAKSSDSDRFYEVTLDIPDQVQSYTEERTFKELGIDYNLNIDCETLSYGSPVYSDFFSDFLHNSDISQLWKVPFPEYYLYLNNYLYTTLLSPGVVRCQHKITFGPSEDHPVDKYKWTFDINVEAENVTYYKMSKKSLASEGSVTLTRPNAKDSSKWEYELKFENEYGDFLNSIQLKGARTAKHQKNINFCAGYDKTWKDETTRGKYYFNFGESYEAPNCEESSGLTITWKGDTSGEQDNHKLNELDTYRECLTNTKYLSQKPTFSYPCVYAHTTLRYYVYDIVPNDLPADFQYYYDAAIKFLQTTYSATTELGDTNVDAGDIRVKVEYPMRQTYDKAVTITLETPHTTTAISTSFHGIWMWPLQMDNPYFSHYFSLHRYTGRTTTCTLKDHHFNIGKYHQFDLKPVGFDRDWTQLIVNKNAKYGDWGVYAQKEKDEIRMKFVLNNSTVVISPNPHYDPEHHKEENTKYLYQIDGVMFEYLHNLDRFDEIEFKLFQVLDSVVLVIPSATVMAVYDGSDITIEFYNFKDEFYGVCIE